MTDSEFILALDGTVGLPNDPIIKAHRERLRNIAAMLADRPPVDAVPGEPSELGPWRVGEFVSSANRPARVLMLAVGEKQIAEYGAHRDFVRWVATTTAPQAVGEPVAHLKPGSAGAYVYVHGVEVPDFRLGCGDDVRRQAFVDAVNRAAPVAPRAGEVERLAQWLDAKWARHGEVEDREAAAMLRQLATLKAAPGAEGEQS